jgi:glycogen(starch) synthase
VRFVVAGWGDLGPQIVERVAAEGLSPRVRFAGFLRGPEVERAYRMADVYVMPSISEPFGLTALEAIQYGVPVVLSKNSGVAEVLHRGALKVDFWDVDQMADKIIALLRHPALGEVVCREGADEIRPLTWDEAARKCVGVYREQVESLKS